MSAVGWAVLEAVFPGRCLVCGAWLLGRGAGPYPVCPDCVSSLNAISGPRCAKCSMPLVSEIDTCMRCRQSEYAFERNVSLFPYQGPVMTLIRELKFSGRRRLSRLFADLLSEQLFREFPGLPVVPVPGRRKKDAVEAIAWSLETHHKTPVLRLLERTGGRPQKSLDFEERKKNITGRIRLSNQEREIGKLPAEAALLDDIFTTGATADACARVLLNGGCRSVSVITVAMEI